MESLYLHTGLATVVCTTKAKEYGTALIGQLEARIEAWDKAHPINVPCTGDIRCERTGKRHKAGCLGRIEPAEIYFRGMSNV